MASRNNTSVMSSREKPQRLHRSQKYEELMRSEAQQQAQAPVTTAVFPLKVNFMIFYEYKLKTCKIIIDFEKIYN